MRNMKNWAPARMLTFSFNGRFERDRSFASPFVIKLVAMLWLLIVAGGAILLEIHATSPGKQNDAPQRWPESSCIAADSDGATLLVFLHPYCPCARATLGELAVIMLPRRERLAAHVLFVVPGDEQPNWQENELWQAAAAIPGVHVVVDKDGIETKTFGARTSGETLLFDQSGARLFCGGITASRGHAGDNLGQQAIVSYLEHGNPEVGRAPTFGCPLPIETSNVNLEFAP